MSELLYKDRVREYSFLRSVQSLIWLENLDESYFDIYSNGINYTHKNIFFLWDDIDEIYFLYDFTPTDVREVDIVLKKNNKRLAVIPTHLKKDEIKDVKKIIEDTVKNKVIVSQKTAISGPAVFIFALLLSFILLLAVFASMNFIGKIILFGLLIILIVIQHKKMKN